MAGIGDLMSELPRQGYGLLMTLHLPGLLVRLLVEVREGGARQGSSQMMSDGRCLHPRVVATTLQVSPKILDQSGDSGGAHSLIWRPLLLWLLSSWWRCGSHDELLT